jgi:cytidine deaminase
MASSPEATVSTGATRLVGRVPFPQLADPDRELLLRARDVATRAYAPYSAFGVGAAVRTKGGAIYAGANMENASYGLTLCAEASALLQSVAAGDFQVDSIAVVGGPLEGGASGKDVVTPCGRCRQLILESSHVSDRDVRVISANSDLSEILIQPISVLLPHGFGPKNLGR